MTHLLIRPGCLICWAAHRCMLPSPLRRLSCSSINVAFLIPALAATLFLSACSKSSKENNKPTPSPSAAPTASPTPTVASNYQAAKPIKQPAPAYPTLGLLNRAEGVVRVRFGINEQGKVETVKVVKSAGSVMLDSVVLDPTLKDWTFQPAMLDGKPIASSVEREFEFRLDPEEQRKLAEERLAAPIGLPDPSYPPAALPLKLQGTCTIGVFWTPQGLVNTIFLVKGSGSNILNRAALRYAFTHWHIDPKNIAYTKDSEGRDQAFTKDVTFTLPAVGASPTP